MRTRRHTAILLCAANYLAHEVDFDGTLNLIFQPAEENEGGALRMVDEGLFDRFPCDEIYALHNSPGLPVGSMPILPSTSLIAARVSEPTAPSGSPTL